ncbi:MAG TPA: hypothetical protein VH369_01735 [Bryobacteraceae bacterium]|jgi:hypothetical protein
MARWVHMVAVLLMAALIGNSQCYGLCLASHCKASQDCHHSSRSSDDGHAACHYWQSNTAGVEASADLAKTPPAAMPVAPADVLVCDSLAGLYIVRAELFHRGSPPGQVSILRI